MSSIPSIMRIPLIMLFVFGLVSTATADIDQKKGVGFAQAIGGPTGLAINYGVGSLGLEAIIGMSRFSYLDDTPEPRVIFASGLGAHFHLLNSRNGALSVGARFNIATGSARASTQTAAGSLPDVNEVTQVGLDVPLRVYWFPTRHISIHTEFGVAILMGSDDGLLFSARDVDSELAPEGLAVIAFRHSTPLGQLGLTYWW